MTQPPSSVSSALPECMQHDDPSAADAARKRLAPKRRFPIFASLPNLRRVSSASPAPEGNGKAMGKKKAMPIDSTDAQSLDPALIVQKTQSTDNDGIVLQCGDSPESAGGSRNEYRWAVLYENQRGITIFSMMYYSSRGLLPTDPLPFTKPDAAPTRSHQPVLSLDTYPLPDGNWRWVSKAWMIDMRHEGEVQYDGFEYNWKFRKNGWRSNASSAGGGGLVRRRMWVRLMMKPGKPMMPGHCARQGDPQDGEGSRIPGSSASSSVAGFGFEVPDAMFKLEEDEVWKGTPEQNWERCHSLMKRLGRDGKRLELWKRWLSAYTMSQEQDPAKMERQPSLDAHVLPRRDGSLQQAAVIPDLEDIRQVLRSHGSAFMHSFIYPESRSELLELLAQAGLSSDLELGRLCGVDFWSYTTDLEKSRTEEPDHSLSTTNPKVETEEGEKGLWNEEEWKWTEEADIEAPIDAGAGR